LTLRNNVMTSLCGAICWKYFPGDGITRVHFYLVGDVVAY